MIDMTPKKRGGSRKGIPNKNTAAVKEALELAFDKLGGAEALAKWAKAEPTEFYKLWAKLLPKDINANVSGGLTVEWPLPMTELDR